MPLKAGAPDLTGQQWILVEDAVAETSRELHEAEVKILGLAFAAEVKTTDGMVAMLNDFAATRN
jgi:hypothetical protein